MTFKGNKPVQASGNRLLMGYEGDMKLMKSRPRITLKNNTETLSTIVTQFPKKDSLQIWYKPLKADSLNLEVTKDKYVDNFMLKIKDQKKDSLNISALYGGTLNFRDRFTLETTTPLVNFDDSKIKLMANDSIPIAFSSEYDDFNQKLFFDFKKNPSEKYTFTILPGALTDFYEKSNDTLIYKVNTKSTAEYGNLRVILQNLKNFPVIIELTNAKGDLIASEYSESNTTVDFNLLEPALFTLRLIYDENKNKVYDSGSYLEKRYAEEVIYYSKEIDVRANWDVEQAFDVSIPYSPEPKRNTAKKKQ
jgi:hypothetical protein